MKNKLIIVAVLVLIVILVGVWLYPSDKSTDEKEEVTGRAITTEKEEVEETKEEPKVETQAEEESEVDDILDDELINECLTTCGADAKTSLEVDIWKSICNKKYNSGEEKIRDFIKSC